MTGLDHPLTDGVVVIRGFDISDRQTLIAGRDEVFRRFLGEGSPEPAPTACICVEDTIVGWIDYEHDRDWLDEHEVNVGYNVFLEHRGRGYGTSALRLLCGFLDAQDPPLVPTLLIDPDNGPSLALGKRAGFEDVGEINGQRLLRRAADALVSSLSGSLITRTFAFDDGRDVTAYVPPGLPDSVVYAVDGGWHIERLARALEDSVEPEGLSTVVIGVHGLDDDDGRLHEYVEAFGGERFDVFERFFVGEVRSWAMSELAVELTTERIAVWGASLGGEFALAMGMRHPEKFGAVLCASPGGGFTPADSKLSGVAPRTYLVGGAQEEWFFGNASRWADALRQAGADVVIEKRDGEHGGDFWYDEFPRMISWAFTRRALPYRSGAGGVQGVAGHDEGDQSC